MVAIVGPLAGGLTTAGAVQSEIVRGGQKKIGRTFDDLVQSLVAGSTRFCACAVAVDLQPS